MKSLRILAFLFASAQLLTSQTTTATISGQIKDPTGAPISGAQVTATAVETGVAHRTASDSGGNYTLPLLPVGPYRVRVESAGFTTIDRSGLTLAVDQRAELNFTMQLGNTSEVVNVSANSSQLETEQHSTGTVMDDRKISELPLNSRTFYALAYLVPGVVPPANNSYLGFRGGFNVAGAPENANNFTVDGFDNNNEQLGSPGFRPSVDAILEFKVLTGMYSAEYGRDAGGQVVVTGKSGTNSYHGLLYEYVRNQIFDARNFFAGSAKPEYKRNQFGGTFGGPIVKDKTFFFFNYEGLRFHQQLSALATVPTPAMLTGDFSSLLPGVQLKDPFTGVPIPGNKINTLAQYTTQAAVIGQALASYFPAPTSPTAAGAKPANNYLFNPLRPESANQFGIRGDHNFSQRDSLYAEVNHYIDNSTEPYNTLCGTRVLPGFGCVSGLTFWLGGISETHVFTPNLLNNLRVSYNRYEQSRLQQDASINFIGKYNIPNVFLGTATNNTGLPQVSVTGYSAFGGPTNNPQDGINNEFQWADQLVWSKGAHTFKFGVDIRRQQGNTLSILTGRGAFTFSGSAGTPTTGYPLADLLLGLPTSSSNNPYAPKIYERNSAFNGYVQDDWKLTSRLTLNLGLRWELNTPFTALNNQEATFDPPLGKVVQAGTNGFGSNLIPYQYNLFQPRVGFAYKATSKTVVRGGYGIYANAPTSFAGIGNLFYNAPMRNPQTFNSSTAAPLLLSNPFPVNASGGTAAPYGIDPSFRNAYVQQYGIGLQQQLTTNLLFDVSYFGTKGTHLPNSINLNQPPAQSATTATAGVNALRPFPAFGNIVYYQSEGISNFNSLQAKLEQRFTGGVTFLVAYTYSKSLDNAPGFNGSNASNASPQNTYDRHSEYGPSDFDVRHRLTASGVYQLPFGSRRQMADGRIAFQSCRRLATL